MADVLNSSATTPLRNKKRPSLIRTNLNSSLNSSLSVGPNNVLSPASNQNFSTSTDVAKQGDQKRRSMRADDLLSSSHVPNKEQLESSTIDSPNMNDQELLEHYQSCIQLVSSGKVTTKNAFSLHLIDVMSDVLSSCSKETFFQVAGCTLDAGAKIYSYRVDGLHNDAYRVATDLGGGGNKEAAQHEDENGGQNDPDNDDYENQLPAVLKKRKKNFKCFVDDTSKILKHVDYSKNDAVLGKAISLTDTNKSQILCTNMPLIDDEERREKILIDGKEKMSFATKHHDAVSFPRISREVLNLPDADVLKKRPVCPPVDDIYQYFNQCTGEDKGNVSINDLDRSAMTKFLNDVDTNFIFDADAPCVDNDDNLGDVDDDFTIGFDEDNQVDGARGGIGADQQQGSVLMTSDFDLGEVSNFSVIDRSLKSLLDFVQPGEFCNFSEPVLKAFFGNKAVQNPNKKKPQTKTKKKVTPDNVMVVYSTTKVQLAAKKTTAAITLSDGRSENRNKTCAKYSRVEYLQSQWTKYFELDFSFLKKTTDTNKNSADVELDEGYDYQNPLDSSNAVRGLRPDDYQNDDGGDNDANLDADDKPLFANIEDDQHDYEIDNNLSLIDNPDALVDNPLGNVEEYKIRFAKRAKNVDVRKVKRCVLNSLKQKQESPDPVAKLTDLHRIAHKSLPSAAVRDLSIPMTFVALLDLASEQNLKLYCDDKVTNVLVEFA